MAGELRWILLALSAVLLIGIVAWGARRSRQAPGNAQLRESTPPYDPAPYAAAPQASAPNFSTSNQAAVEARRPEGHGWGVPPFEPLSIRTADFDPVPLLDLPMTATSPPIGGDHIAETGKRLTAHPPESAPATPMTAATTTTAVSGTGTGSRSPGTDRDAGSRAKTPTLHASSAAPPAAAAAAAAAAHSAGSAIRATSAQFAAAPEPASTARPAPPAPPAPSVAPALVAPISVAPSPAAVPAAPAAPAAPEVKANASESQRVVTIRVAAQSDALWDGSTLLAALEKHGLGFGRYKVFHRKHVDGRTLFCVASLVEPGTFDLPKMPEQEFRGLTLFAVLPGPLDAMQSVDMLVTTAGELAATLHGVVQDSQGAPLTAERALELRDEVARFQASLVT